MYKIGVFLCVFGLALNAAQVEKLDPVVGQDLLMKAVNAGDILSFDRIISENPGWLSWHPTELVVTAAEQGHDDIVQSMIACGLKDIQHKGALQWALGKAVFHNHPKVVRTLLRAGVSPNEVEMEPGQNVLHYAVESCNHEIVGEFVAWQPSLLLDQEIMPFHTAAWYACKASPKNFAMREYVLKLLLAGAHNGKILSEVLAVKNYAGKTVKEVACEHKKDDLMKFLEDCENGMPDAFAELSYIGKKNKNITALVHQQQLVGGKIKY